MNEFQPAPTQHNFSIVTTHEGKIKENNTILIDFDTMESATLQFEVVDEYHTDPKTFKDIEWVIYENLVRVDDDDYTGGQKAELKLYKSQAGSHDSPSYIEVQIIHPTEGIVDTVRIALVASPKITKAQWIDTNEFQNITEAKFNSVVGFELDGEGIHGVPLTIDICLEENDEILDHFTATKDRSLYHVNLKKEWHVRHHLFFTVIKKVYLVISYLSQDGIKVIYNGKKQSNLLTINGKESSIEPKVVPTSIMTVQVGADPYFTQRYEPCKYETISYTFADQPKVIIFDENNNSSDTPHRQPRIAVPVGAHKQPLVIEVAGHDPNTLCSAVERGEKAHTSRIINIEEIPERFIDSYDGQTVSFTPYFPYEYLDEEQNIQQNRYLHFLAEYFFPPTSQYISIPVETCRYTKTIDVAIHPDIAWALHFRCALSSDQLEKKPDQLEITDRKDMYFREIEDIQLHVGLNKLIDKYRDIVEKVLGGNIPSAIWPDIPNFSPQSFIWSLIIDYIRSIGSCMALGLHTYYNEEDQNTRKIISYTERYPYIVNTLLVYPIMVLIAADILALIFSGGATKTAQFGLKISSKVARKAAKVQKYKDRFQWIERKTEHGVFHIAWPVVSLSLGKGYRVHPDGSSGYHYEIKWTATPIFGLLFRSEGSIGDFIVNFSPIGWGFTTARWGVGMVGKVLKLKRYQKNAPLAKRAFEMGHNPYKALRKTSKNKDYFTPGRIIGILNEAEDNVKKKAEAIAKEMGLELNYYFSIEGTYRAKFEIDINLDDPNAPQLTMKNHLPDGTYTSHSRDSKTSEVAFSRKTNIDAYAYLAINNNIMFMTNWIAPYIPDWLGVSEEDFKNNIAQTNIEGRAMLMGGIAFELKYGCDTLRGPYMQEFIHFSGIAGKYLLKVEKKRNKGESDDIDPTLPNKPKKKPPMVEFILMEPKTITGSKRYLLAKEDITNAI